MSRVLVVVKMKNGTAREWRPGARIGGSYRNRVRYETGFVVVTDEFDKETAIPTADVAEVIVDPGATW